MELSELKGIVCKTIDIPISELSGERKTDEIAIARNIYIHFALMQCPSKPLIAKSINKSIRTVQNASQHFDEKIKYDRVFSYFFNIVKKEIECSK